VSRLDPTGASPGLPPGPDVAAALARVRAVFGPVEVLEVCAHAPDPGQAPPAAPVQGCLGLDQETG
jgi:hypothetical protein